MLENSAKDRDLIVARTVTFGFRARFFAHSTPAKYTAAVGLVIGVLVAPFIGGALANLLLAPLDWAWGALVRQSELIILHMWQQELWPASLPTADWAGQVVRSTNGRSEHLPRWVMQYLALSLFVALPFFLVAYWLCAMWVGGFSANIRATQWPRSWLAVLPKRVTNRLAALSHEPFIVCRKACRSSAAVAWLVRSRESALDELRGRRLNPDWGLLHQNHAIAIATTRSLGAKVWPYDREKFFADVVTGRAQQKTIANDHDQFDLELRFVQDEPQRPFSGGDLSKPVYAIFQCLFNPIKDPVWVLPLSDVMRRLEELCANPEVGLSFDAAVQTLRSASFPVFRRIERDLLAGVRVQRAEDPLMPILVVDRDAGGNTRYRSGYDENNILYDIVPPAARKALFLFQMALDTAARLDAVSIDLNRGDMLLVRSQEAFYCRREMDDHWYNSPTSLPRARWLRRYMAFEAGSNPSERATISATHKLNAMLRAMKGWRSGAPSPEAHPAAAQGRSTPRSGGAR